MSGGEYERGVATRSLEFFLIYVSENAFQAILKHIFPYLITPILSKIRHSNTVFLTIILHFLVVLLMLW